MNLKSFCQDKIKLCVHAIFVGFFNRKHFIPSIHIINTPTIQHMEYKTIDTAKTENILRIRFNTWTIL